MDVHQLEALSAPMQQCPGLGQWHHARGAARSHLPSAARVGVCAVWTLGRTLSTLRAFRSVFRSVVIQSGHVVLGVVVSGRSIDV